MSKKKKNDDQMILDIIIPTHNKLEMTIQCLKRLYTFTSIPFRVFLIDDSDDETPIWIENHKDEFPALNYVRPDNGQKFKCGNEIINLGLQISTSPYVAHICNSVLVEPQWVDMAIELIKLHKDVGVVGFKLLLPSSFLIEHAGIGMGDVVPVDMGRGELSHHHTYIKERDAVAWSMVLLRREAVEGNLEENIYHGFKGWDDIDNCLVIHEKGWKVLYCGAGAGVHYAHYTRAGKGQEDRDKVYDNMRVFIKRWPGKITATEVNQIDKTNILDERGFPPLDLKLAV
jgi:GT2 family glycosyltransferase